MGSGVFSLRRAVLFVPPSFSSDFQPSTCQNILTSHLLLAGGDESVREKIKKE